MGRIVSINLSDGGVPKLPVEAVRVTKTGIEGDRQRNTKNHGGPEKAVSLFSMERIEALNAEGHPIAPGSTGENITVSGLDWDRLVPGGQLSAGSVLLEITGYATPCKDVAASFTEGAFERISEKRHPGWSRLYARVLQEGEIKTGDPVERIE
ncbi:MAG: MOSC domain-containing protein [Planctomycetota bacterium]|jgi:MOSC domain-containing protein YiiM